MAIERQSLSFVDWLRVGVISLVVAHHAGQAYGPTGGAWPVFEVERTQLLSPFFTVNAGFFMGLFFFLSGCFVPMSLGRKGAVRYVKDRLIRLGIPLIVVGLGIFALIGYGGDGTGRGFWTYYIDTYIGGPEIEFAHLWFVFHLLIYTAIYAALSVGFPRLTQSGSRPAPGHLELIGLVLVITAGSALTRTAFSQDDWIKIAGILPVEPVHLPQYVCMFIAGTIAGRHSWLQTIDRRVGLIWLGLGLAAAIFWYVQRYLDIYTGVRVMDRQTISVIFPLWEAVLCVGLSIGLIVFARNRVTAKPGWLAPLAAASFGVYIVHVFIVVGLNSALLGVAVPPIVKFSVTTAAALILSFALALGLKRVPGVRAVL